MRGVGERIDLGRGGLLTGLRRVDHLQRIRRRHALEQCGEGQDLVVVHVPDVDVDPLDPGNLTDRLDHPAGQLGPGLVAGQRHRQRNDRGRAVDRDPLQQAELDDRAPQFRLLDRRQRGLDVERFGHARSPADFHYRRR